MEKVWNMLGINATDEIKWGIIGCGDVTEIKSGPAFNKVLHSSLVAVMRRDGSKAKDYADRHGVPKWYDDATALINDPEINAIYIATPPLQHEEYTLMALAAGKPVYVEKPMTLNADAALRMKAAAEKYGVKLSVAHYRREQPMFLKVKSLIDEKVIGEVSLVQLKMFQPHQSDLIADSATNWRLDPAVSGGGLFHDLAPHQLDLMVYFFGDVLKSSGISLNQAGLYIADDIVSGQILFKNGVLFNGTWCFTAAEKVDVCEIIGNKGKISFPIFGHKVTLSKHGEEEDFIFDPLPHVQQPMIEQVVKYFLGRTENPCSADEALLSMQLIDSFTSHEKIS
ncbi:Gfo/Idh/MocA family oxidoreductase [Pedobacter heparinus]|uniref:Gfo/Idh/MocA family protein n=1 Tax=Pedobacter heparinus TaxID=984 RepID=UPI00292FC4E2|nr:Gfo/Idh/MocA family oxidoreductase [Pedobacter heparinus]